MVERQTGILRTDNETEFVNSSMSSNMNRDGVIHQTSCPYTPEQIGAAESMNRTLAKSMLADARLPKTFWMEVISAAAYLINRSSWSK